MKARSTLWKPTPGSPPRNSLLDITNSKGRGCHLLPFFDVSGTSGTNNACRVAGGRSLFLSSSALSLLLSWSGLWSFRCPSLRTGHAVSPVRKRWAAPLNGLSGMPCSTHLQESPVASGMPSATPLQVSCSELASSPLLAYHIKMQHPLLILSRLFFAVMAERHWRSHL